ncbi:transcriptional regulator, TetR family [Parvibaculum lavamentivorans DS-1]|uniref:Transcriptional regulator, TetR family n=1 Tax=Parvibaculum lavamentivorans (strain DS-1 / DSM 13023 / NCIMB 13966) TaxID=402881 RepID=A7HV90_PARL1|nr:TetR/AcrR family transcriptional regulator [Parvibaculum lavamentivorans]ABS63823.1 transcriptional regulator, TetR family [Parvibaculum lavamentivorans DS-1]
MNMPVSRSAPAKKPSKNREQLLAAARRLFGLRGYGEVGTEEIVREAGVTRGALYYQFADKQDLFRALFISMLHEIGHEVFEETMARVTHDTEDLMVGTQMLLDVYSRAEVKQIVLIDGPAVLGWNEWRDLQEPLHQAMLTHALQHLVDEGWLAPQPLEPVASLIAGALMQAGLAIANADDPAEARKIYGRGLETLVEGFTRRRND